MFALGQSSLGLGGAKWLGSSWSATSPMCATNLPSLGRWQIVVWQVILQVKLSEAAMTPHFAYTACASR